MDKLANALSKEPKAKRIMEDFQRHKASFSMSSPSLVEHRNTRETDKFMLESKNTGNNNSNYTRSSGRKRRSRKDTENNSKQQEDSDEEESPQDNSQERKRRKGNRGDPIRVFINIADTIEVPVNLYSDDNADQFRKGILGAFKQKFGQSAPEFQILDITRTKANSSSGDSRTTNTNSGDPKNNTNTTGGSSSSSSTRGMTRRSSSSSSSSSLSTSESEESGAPRRRRSSRRRSKQEVESTAEETNARGNEMPVVFNDQDTVQQHFQENDRINIHAAPINKLERDFSEELLRVHRLERGENDQKEASVGCQPYCQRLAKYGNNNTKCKKCDQIRPYALPDRYGIYCSPWCVHHSKLVHHDSSHRKRAEARKVKKANQEFCATCLLRYNRHQYPAGKPHQCRLCHRPWLKLGHDDLCSNCTNVIRQRTSHRLLFQGRIMSDMNPKGMMTSNTTSRLLAMHATHASTGTLLSPSLSLSQHPDKHNQQFTRSRASGRRRPSNVVTEEQVARELLALEQTHAKQEQEMLIEDTQQDTSSSSSSSSSSSRSSMRATRKIRGRK